MTVNDQWAGMAQKNTKSDTDVIALTSDSSFQAKGRGLNSIPIRFALMGLVVCSIGFALQVRYVFGANLGEFSGIEIAIAAVTLSLPAAITYFAARKLAGMIGALRNSTIAILQGEINSPVDVDCNCEVGGLADSFRAMVARLNSNILRMNILAFTDSVTGLPNRTVINHVLNLTKSKGPENCRGALFFIDLDGFKRVNDTYGHDAGDELLRATSQRLIEAGFGIRRDELDTCTTTFGELCQSCPTSLVFARFAGDEFVALLPGEFDEAQLAEIGARLLAALQQPFQIFANEIAIGASVGIALIDERVTDPSDLIVHADIAMYEAKERGRNRVAFFDANLKERAAQRIELEKELRQALERDELTLNFQPRTLVSDNSVAGVEALARWFHPTKGAVPPSRFIPIAEQSGCMAALGDSVLRLSVAQAKSWGQAGINVPVAVNVSPIQFESRDLVASVSALLTEHDLDPAQLELEITETLAMFDYAASKRRIDELRALGVRLAIDDFGTGYSNLSQLSRLNVDMIKIDRSLVTGIGVNGKAEALLNATIGMGHALGLTIVAEGIETLDQLRVLQELRCDQVQGFFIARPMIASDLITWQAHRFADGIGAMRTELENQLAG